MTIFKTQHQAVQTLTKLLQAHGYDPADYDLVSIADEYHQQHDNYDVLEHPSTIWAAVFDNEQHKTTTPPAAFTPRDWDAPEYADIAPRDRFEISEGPASGGVESIWQPGWGVLLNLPPVGHTGDGLGVTISEATQLRDNLTVVLKQLGE
jgi:hypothetical protein